MTDERKEAILEAAAIFLSRFISGEIVLLDDRALEEMKSESPNKALLEEYSARLHWYRNLLFLLQ